MAHAEKCPICDGTGNLAKEMYPYEGTRQTCHGCNGKGWVEVADTLPIDNLSYIIPTEQEILGNK